MEDDKTLEAGAPAEETPEAPVILEPVAPPAATPDIREREFKGLQKAHSALLKEKARLEQELATERLTTERVQEIHQRMDSLENMVAVALDQQAGISPAESAQETYQAKLQRQRQEKEAKRPTQPQFNPVASAYWYEIVADCEEAGIPSESVFQDPQVQELGKAGKYRQARKRAQEVIAERGKPQGNVEETAKKMAEELYQERVKQSGLKDLNIGTGSGGPKRWTRERLREMSKTPEGLVEFRKHEREIMDAERKGEIK